MGNDEQARDYFAGAAMAILVGADSRRAADIAAQAYAIADAMMVERHKRNIDDYNKRNAERVRNAGK